MTKLSITLRDKDGEFTVTQEHVSGQKLLDYWDCLFQTFIKNGLISSLVYSIVQR